MMCNGHITVSKISLSLIEQLNDYMVGYEESNLKHYADAKFENFMLFKHPLKTESIEQHESLVKSFSC